MLTDTMPIENEIIEKSHNGIAPPCVSIIIPTHKTSADRALDQLEVTKMLEKAKDILQYKYGNTDSNKIINVLDDMAKGIDYLHNDKGIGFFVSPEYSETVNFPFAVKEKLFVGDNFEVRDLIYLSDYLTKYILLTINLNEIKLFEGHGKILKEVKDENFPARFTDDYEYERSSLGSSYGYSLKNVEKDKSIIKEIRFFSFLKEVDKKLSKHLSNGTPLIISGVKKELGYFQKITSHPKNIIGKIAGNYYQNTNGLLGQLAQKEMEKHHLKLEEEALLKLESSIGKNLAAVGIEEVWSAAQQGKGLLLLLEKDYTKLGFITNDKYKLYIEPTLKKHKLLTDCVDEIIDLVNKKHGKVMFLDNGKLEKFQKIALILRY